MPEHFTVSEVASGVFACVAGASQAAVGNAAIVDTGARTIVVDSFMTTVGAAELRLVAEQLTGRSVFMLINTHWHGDHTFGNQVFADVSIVATKTTSRAIAADSTRDLDAYGAELDAAIARFEVMLESDSEADRILAERRLRRLALLRADVGVFEMTLPNVLIDDELVVEDQRRVEILTYGGGHTDSDVFVWLPDVRTVVAGDLAFHGKHPRMVDAHLDVWGAILRRILALGPATVIPGHGEPGDQGQLELLVPYFEEAQRLLVEYDGDWEKVPLPAGTEAWDWEFHYSQGLAAIAAR
ncbi:MAG: MBL fold metallo-hydrolase [Acidimicrobiia bacterium]|nr:MBL fold metallo-hydrolase [Acidimicrobiia bacterium]